MSTYSRTLQYPGSTSAQADGPLPDLQPAPQLMITA